MRPLLAVPLLLLPLAVGASELDGHAAHEHGVAHLTIALENRTLVIELISPADNVVGFEHAPRKPGEKAAVAAGVATLRRAGLVMPNADAGCKQDKAQADNPFAAAAHSSHRDFEARYTLTCQRPEKLQQLDTAPLFKALPRMKTLEVDYALPGSQGHAELTPMATVVRIER